MITGLQHIGIYCEDIKQAIDFYTKVFGFKIEIMADNIATDA